MRMKSVCLFSLLYILLSPIIFAQTPVVDVLTTGTKTSIRGLSVVNDNVIWVSGSNGKVGRSNSGGKNWSWFTVKGFEKTEFRDIEAFDASTAIIMGVEKPACILKTTDGGESWKVVFESNAKGMFLDAMHFLGREWGMVVGDPVDGKAFIAATVNGGESWQEWAADKRPRLDSGEAFFAASGTNIRFFRDNNFFLVSGGTKSRLLTEKSATLLPLVQGTESTGANSVAVYDNGNLKGSKKIIVVGGDFSKDSSTINNCFMSNDGGKTWKAPKVPPHGYRSSVEFLSSKDIMACGLNGVDYSSNGGKEFQWISKESFNVCRIAKLGTTIYLAGNNGKVAKIVWR